MVSLVKGAQTTLYCCLEPKIANDSGRYYSDCKEKICSTQGAGREVTKEAVGDEREDGGAEIATTVWRIQECLVILMAATTIFFIV